MKSISRYGFFKTKYGDELLIDVVELDYIKKHMKDNQPHILTYYDITLITEGIGSFSVDTQTYTVNPGDVLFSRPGEIRKWDTANIHHGYALIFEKEFLSSFFKDARFVDQLAYFHPGRSIARLTLPSLLFSHIESLMDRIRDEINHFRIRDRHMLRALLYETLILLDRTFQQTCMPDDPPRYGNPYVTRFEELVTAHFREERSIRYYSDILCITPNYLNEIVKKHLGVSAKSYIQGKVLAEAKRMLVYTSDTISEISGNLNFDNASYFIRFFRMQTGSSPLQYRKNVKP